MRRRRPTHLIPALRERPSRSAGPRHIIRSIRLLVRARMTGRRLEAEYAAMAGDAAAEAEALEWAEAMIGDVGDEPWLAE